MSVSESDSSDQVPVKISNSKIRNPMTHKKKNEFSQNLISSKI